MFFEMKFVFVRLETAEKRPEWLYSKIQCTNKMSILSSNTTLGSCYKPGEIVGIKIFTRYFFFYRILNVSLKRIKKIARFFHKYFIHNYAGVYKIKLLLE